MLTGIATLFVFIQFFTSSEFIRARGEAGEAWTDVHGVTAYGVLVPALIAAIIALVSFRRAAPVLTVVSVVFFIAAVGQWGTGHLISTLEMDGWTPFHVFFSSVVLALAIWASVRSATLRRLRPPPRWMIPEARGPSTPEPEDVTGAMDGDARIAAPERAEAVRHLARRRGT